MSLPQHTHGRISLTCCSTAASQTATTATPTPALHLAEHTPAPRLLPTTPVPKAASTAAVPRATRAIPHPHQDSSHTVKPRAATAHNNTHPSPSTANIKATAHRPVSVDSQVMVVQRPHTAKDPPVDRLEATDSKV
jgi:hypothetical protein